LLRDHGPGYSHRGVCLVTVVDPEPLISLAMKKEKEKEIEKKPGSALLIGSPTDRNATDVYVLVKKYHESLNSIFATMEPTSDEIRVPKLPIYTLSGGMTMPSCAFVFFRTPPSGPEEYYTNAMAVALRRSPWEKEGDSDAFLADWFCDSSDGGDEEMFDRKASILMDAATLLSVSFPYIYDFGMSMDGTRLVNADEFARIARITMALDCEDGAVETLMFLWEILRTRWSRSRVLAKASEIRKRFVVTVCLKAVTRPAESGDTSKHTNARRGLAAHASCDMIPIFRFAKMLERGRCKPEDRAAIEAIIQERSLTENPKLDRRSVIGETTGYVCSYVHPTNAKPSTWAKTEIRRILGHVIRKARLVSKVYYYSSLCKQ
jgi:hypothetical protein